MTNECKLCGKSDLKFEPPVLYCSGMSCGMSRIKRDEFFHSDAKRQNFWCEACFNELKLNQVIILDDGSEIKKSKLYKAKHDSVPKEAFLECHSCKARVHEICALYNSRKARRCEIFRCPKCILAYRTIEPKKAHGTAAELPRCRMSDFLEEGLSKSLEKAYSRTAKELGVDISEVETANGLCIRVLSHVKTKHAVRDEVSVLRFVWLLLLSLSLTNAIGMIVSDVQ
jgi:E1A/CREB-binding protein